MKQHSICFLWCVCQPFYRGVCARGGVCVCVRAQESFTLESSAPCRAGLHSWHPPDCAQLSKWICLADHVDSSVCFWFQLMESVSLMTIHFLCRIPTAAKTMRCCGFWLWTFWRMTEETREESQHKISFWLLPSPLSFPSNLIAVSFHGEMEPPVTFACDWCALMWGLLQEICVCIWVRVGHVCCSVWAPSRSHSLSLFLSGCMMLVSCASPH